MYGDGEFRPDRAYPYVAFANTVSQSWALYCLVLLYHACHAELAPMRPLAKFVVIKARPGLAWGGEGGNEGEYINERKQGIDGRKGGAVHSARFA